MLGKHCRAVKEGYYKVKIAVVCAEDEYPGIGYLSAYLKEHGVHIYLVFEPKQFGRAYLRSSFLAKIFSRERENLERLKNIRPDLIGFSCVTAHYQWALGFAQKVKRELPEIPIIFGGVHPTLVPELVIKEDCVDFVCIGEGERPLLELLQSLEKGDGEYHIPNIWYKKDGHLITNPLRPLLENLDELPFIDKLLFCNYLPRNYRESVQFSASRGCPFTCNYCGNEQMKKTFHGLGNYVRQMSVSRAIDELFFLKKCGAKYILFGDDIFTANHKWLKDFVPVYKKKVGLPFTCFGHPKFLSRENIKLLKEGGCRLLWFGIQSASEDIRLKVMNRYETNSEIIRAAKLCHEAGLPFMVDHILNIPYDTEEAIKEAIALYNEIRPEMINCYRLLYFPKAKIIDIAVESGLLKPKDVDLINQGKSVVYQTGELSSPTQDFYRKYALLLTAIPLLPKRVVAVIQRNDRLIDFSGHLPLFLIPLIKVLLNFKIGHGMLPLKILQNEVFFTRSFLSLKTKNLFSFKRR